jgi:transmembrane sensor
VSKPARSLPTLEQMEVAMAWIQRLSEEDSSERDAADWLTWYESDDANRQAFDEMQALWIDAGKLGEGADGPARIASIEQIDVPPTHAFEKVAVRKAYFRTSVGSVTARATAAAVALLVLVSTVPLYDLYRRETAQPSKAATAVIASEPAVRHTQLPDGSSIDLAAKTSLAVQYTDAQRTLILTSGEAFFSVAPNRSRPFVVNSAGVRIRAVGTQFNVREERDRVIVTVMEGVVDVSSAGSDSDVNKNGSAGALRLNAGNEVTWFVTSGERIVRATTPERALAWRDGRLDYVNETLATVISDVNRYSTTRLVLRDPKIAQMTYTGTVFIRSINEWLRAMPSEFPIRVVHESSEIVIVGSGSAEAAASPD